MKMRRRSGIAASHEVLNGTPCTVLGKPSAVFAFRCAKISENQGFSDIMSAGIDCAHPDMHRRSGIAAVPEASVGRSLHNPSMVNAVGGVTFRGGRTDTLCGFFSGPVAGNRFSYATSTASEETASSTSGIPRRAPRNQRTLQTFHQH